MFKARWNPNIPSQNLFSIDTNCYLYDLFLNALMVAYILLFFQGQTILRNSWKVGVLSGSANLGHIQMKFRLTMLFKSYLYGPFFIMGPWVLSIFRARVILCDIQRSLYCPGHLKVIKYGITLYIESCPFKVEGESFRNVFAGHTGCRWDKSKMSWTSCSSLNTSWLVGQKVLPDYLALNVASYNAISISCGKPEEKLKIPHLIQNGPHIQVST